MNNRQSTSSRRSLWPVLIVAVIGILAVAGFILGRNLGLWPSADSEGTKESETTAPEGTQPDTEEDKKPLYGDEYAIAAEPTYEADYHVTQKNYGEYFCILYCADAVDPGYYFESTSDTPEELSEEVFDRIRRTEAKLGVTISTVDGGTFGEYAHTIGMSLGAGERNVYQMVITHGYAGVTSMMTSGVAMDMTQLEGLNLSAGYWYPDMNQDLRIGDTLRIAYNRFLLPDGYAIGFNREPISRYVNETELYDLAMQREWTLETMLSYAVLGKGADGAEAPNYYGLNVENGLALNALVTSSDIRMVENNPGGLEMSMLYDSAKISKLESMISELLQQETTNSLPYFKVLDLAPEQVLFEMKTLRGLTAGREGKPVERGLLPYPLYDREQENYRTLYAGGYIAIPYAIDHPEMVADVVETLAYESYGVQSSYMDAVIRQIQGNEMPDKAMLQIIRDSMRVELACVLQDPYASWIWNAMMQSCNTEELTVNFVEYLSRDAIQSRIERLLHTAYTEIKGDD